MKLQRDADLTEVPVRYRERTNDRKIKKKNAARVNESDSNCPQLEWPKVLVGSALNHLRMHY